MDLEVSPLKYNYLIFTKFKKLYVDENTAPSTNGTGKHGF